MQLSARFYRIAAICSIVSAITTLCLIFLPEWYAAGEGFESRMARVNDPAYRLRAWAYLIHPFLTWTAALGIAMRIRRSSAALAIAGLAGFSVWAITEAGQQTLTLMVFDNWRAAYLAGDEAVRASMPLRTAIYDGLWDGMYFLLLIAFSIGNTMFAIAMWRGPGLARALSVLYAGAVALTLLIIVGELKGPTLPESIESWLYPAIQPLARALIGVWLWKHADESVPFMDIRQPVR
jgi:hypothetical protein